MVEFTENDHHGEEEVSEEERRDVGEPVDESAAETAAAQEVVATAEETAGEEGEHRESSDEAASSEGADDEGPAEDAAVADDAAESVSDEAADAGEEDGTDGGGAEAEDAASEDDGLDESAEDAATDDADQAVDGDGAEDSAEESAEAEEAGADDDADGDDDDVETMTMDDKYDLVQVRPGDVIKGQIVQVDDEHILVDVGYKAEGLVPLSEMTLKAGESPGDVFQVDEEVYVRVLSIDHRDGALLLSERRARAERVWDELEKALGDETIIEAPVVEEVKGGLVADVGVRAFMPASHVERGYVGDLSQYVGETLRARVIEIDRSKNRVILSRRTVLEIEHEARRAETWASLEEGQVRSGVVKGITDFGAFIDLGGVDGLLHVSEMAWGRVEHPSDVVQEGQDIDVKVLRVDRERERISLGLKQILPDPWEEAHLKYAEDSIIEGKVMRLAPFGAFVQLEPGVEGLVHISQLAHHHVHNPDEVVSEGETVMVKVLRVQSDERRISLSIKEALPPEEVIEYRRPARRNQEEDDRSDDYDAPRERGRGRGRRPAQTAPAHTDDYDAPRNEPVGNGGVTLGDLFGDALAATRQALQAEEDAKAEEGDDAEAAGDDAEADGAEETGGAEAEAEEAEADDADAEEVEAEAADDADDAGDDAEAVEAEAEAAGDADDAGADAEDGSDADDEEE